MEQRWNAARATARRKPSQGTLNRKKLMQRTKLMSQQTSDGGPITEETLFAHACAAGAAEVVANLLAAASPEALERLRSRRNEDGETAMHQACTAGYAGVVSALLNFGFSLLEKDKAERTPLHSLLYSPAVGKGEALFKFLIQNETSLLFCDDAEGKCPLELLEEKEQEQLLEIATDYLSCLAVNRGLSQATEEACAEGRSTGLPPDALASAQKTDEQKAAERAEELKRRTRALDCLGELEFNRFAPATKRALVHAAVPIGWLFRIDGSYMPPRSKTKRSRSSADAMERSGSDSEESRAASPRRGRRGTLGKNSLRALLTESGLGSKEAPEDSPSNEARSRKSSRKVELTCKLNLAAAGLKWLPGGQEFWRSINGVCDVDARRNQIEFIPSVCATPVLPLLKLMYVQDNPLSFMLKDLVSNLQDVTPSPKKTWSAIVKLLNQASKRAASWDVHKLVLVGPNYPMRRKLLKLFLGEETDRLDKADVIIETDRHMKLMKKKKSGLNLHKAERRMRFSYIDLGENDAIRSTRKVFLSQKMIYMVTFDALKAAQQLSEVDFFMHQVRLYTTGVKSQHTTVFVGTVTAEEAASCTKEYWNGVVATMEHRFPPGRGRGFDKILLVNLDSKQHLVELQQYLEGVAASYEAQNEEESPSRTEWRLVHKELKSLSSEVEYWSWATFRALASKFGICKDREQTELALFLQKVGTITFYQEKLEMRSLRNMDPLLILNPRKWAEKLISFSHVSRLTGGAQAYLVDKDLLLEELDLDSKDTSKVLRFLESVGLVYPMQSPSDQVFVPSNLHMPKAQRSDMGWGNCLPAGFIEHGRIYRFESIPVAFLDRLAMMAMHMPTVKTTAIYRHAILLSSSITGAGSLQQEGIVIYRPKSSSQTTYDIHVAVRMPEESFKGMSGACVDRLLLTEVVYLVEMLLSNFYPSLVSTMQRVVPCSHCLCNEQFKDDPHMFDFGEIVASLLDGSKVVHCRGIQSQTRTVRISSLAPDVTLRGVRSIPSSRLVMGEELGKGAFGTVRLAEYRDKQVAVKELSFAGMDFVSEELRREKQVSVSIEFQREVFLMTHMHSNFIVNLLGIEEESLKMVLEYVPEGTLHELVRKKNEELPPAPAFVPAVDCLSWTLRRRIALDVARAMLAMSTNVPPVVHRDLRSPNVFLQSLDPEAAVVAKVADFGLSTMAPGNRAAGMLHSWRWLAPEVIDHVGLRQYGWQSDVYSFGVVVWELCCGLFPFGEYTEELGWDEWDVKQAILHHGLRPTIPEKCPADLAELMRLCWAAEPEERPTFAALVDRLSGPSDSLPGPEFVRKVSLGLENDGPKQSEEADGSAALLAARASFPVPLEVSSMAIVEDTVFLGGADGTVAAMDTTAASATNGLSVVEASRWKAHSKKVTALCVAGPFPASQGKLTKSGKPASPFLLWTASSDGGVRVWSSYELDLEFAFSHSGVVPAMLAVPTSDGCEIWVVAPVDRTVSIYSVNDVNDVQLVHKLKLTATEKGAKEPTPSCIEYGGDGMVLVGAEQLIFVLDSGTREVLCYFKAHERNWLRGMHRVSGTQLLWTYLVRSSTMNVWKVQREPFEVQMVEEVAMHHGKVTAITSSSPAQLAGVPSSPGRSQGSGSRNLVYSSSVHYNVLVWDVHLGRAVDEIELDAVQKEIATCMGRLGTFLLVGTSITKEDGQLGGRLRTFELL